MSIICWEERFSNMKLFFCHVNNPLLAQSWSSTSKTPNKEEQIIMTLLSSALVVRASPYAHYIPQTMLVKEGKEGRLIWDGTTKMAAHEITMNETTPI